MNVTTNFRCVASAIAAGACLIFFAPASSAAEDTPASCKPVGHVQQRVVAKADQGMDALRSYIFITRGIHQLDMMEVAKSLDGWRADARCAERLASAAPRAQ